MILGITRSQAKPFKTADGRIIDPIWISYKTHRDYQTYLQGAQYADGWNAAMDYVFGVNPNKPDIKMVEK